METGSKAGTNFKRISVKQPKRLVLSIDGEEKCGKTRFALTAPKPIGFIDLDSGLEGTAHKHDLAEVLHSDLAAKWKEVQQLSAQQQIRRGDHVQVAHAAAKVWSQFVDDFRWGIRNLRTVVVDTASEMNELIRLARFGKLTQVMPESYGPVYAELSALLKEIYSTEANLVLLHRVKAEYEAAPPSASGKRQPGAKTGKMVRAGFKDIPYIVQTVLRLGKTDEFTATIEHCRHNPALEGEELPSELIEFSTLGMMIFPESKAADWK